MQRPSPPGEQAGRHRLARELVPEHDLGAAVAQHARGEAVVERVQRLVRDGGQHVDLDVEADHRGGGEHVLRGRGEPGCARQHGVADGVRHHAVLAREHLGDVEGVAAGAFAQGVQVDVRAAGQLGDRVTAQRPHVDPPHPAHGRELAEQHPHRVVGPDLVVAEGEQQQGGAVLAAPGEVPDQLQRRRVRPVQVLDQPDRELADQRRAHRREQVEPVDRLAGMGGHVDLERGRHVHQGAERRGRGGAVTAAAQHPARDGGHEVLGEAGLPRARFAADQDRRAVAAAGLVQGSGQRVELRGPLQQHTDS